MLNFTAGSHAILLIRRCEVDDLNEVTVEPISAYAETLLMVAIDAMQQLDRIIFCKILAEIESARAVVSLVYKSLHQQNQNPLITESWRM
jgi:hypothetical protein